MPIIFQNSARYRGISVPGPEMALGAGTEVDVHSADHVQPIEVADESTVRLVGKKWVLAQVLCGAFAMTGPLAVTINAGEAEEESVAFGAGVHDFQSASDFPFTEDADTIDLVNAGNAPVMFEALIGLSVEAPA